MNDLRSETTWAWLMDVEKRQSVLSRKTNNLALKRSVNEIFISGGKKKSKNT